MSFPTQMTSHSTEAGVLFKDSGRGILADLFDTDRFSDISVVLPSTGRRVKCHQVVLTCHSGRFASLLQNGSYTHQELPLAGADPDSLVAVLRFLYTGEAELSPANVVSLYDAANKLEVPNLCNATLQYLSSVLQPQLVPICLDQALACNQAPVADIVLEFFEERQAEVMSSPSFMRLSEQGLARLLSHLAPRRPLQALLDLANAWCSSDPSRLAVAQRLLSAHLSGPPQGGPGAGGPTHGGGYVMMPGPGGPAGGPHGAAGPTPGQFTPAQANSQGGMPVMVVAPQQNVPGMPMMQQNSQGVPMQAIVPPQNSQGMPMQAASSQGMPMQVMVTQDGQTWAVQRPMAPAGFQVMPGGGGATMAPTAMAPTHVGGGPMGMPKAMYAGAGSGGVVDSSGMALVQSPSAWAPNGPSNGLPVPPRQEGVLQQLMRGGGAVMGGEHGHPLGGRMMQGSPQGGGGGGAHEFGARGGAGSSSHEGEPEALRHHLQQQLLQNGGEQEVAPRGGGSGGGNAMVARAGSGFINHNNNQAPRPYKHYEAAPPQQVRTATNNGPRGVCSIEDCRADLSHLRDYHQRFRICDYHLKVPSIMRDGVLNRFCQQCGRFHELTAFDGNKRSCRARLQRHNARRRKRGDVVEDLNGMAGGVEGGGSGGGGGRWGHLGPASPNGLLTQQGMFNAMQQRPSPGQEPFQKRARDGSQPGTPDSEATMGSEDTQGSGLHPDRLASEAGTNKPADERKPADTGYGDTAIVKAGGGPEAKAGTGPAANQPLAAPAGAALRPANNALLAANPVLAALAGGGGDGRHQLQLQLQVQQAQLLLLLQLQAKQQELQLQQHAQQEQLQKQREQQEQQAVVLQQQERQQQGQKPPPAPQVEQQLQLALPEGEQQQREEGQQLAAVQPPEGLQPDKEQEQPQQLNEAGEQPQQQQAEQPAPVNEAQVAGGSVDAAHSMAVVKAEVYGGV